MIFLQFGDGLYHIYHAFGNVGDCLLLGLPHYYASQRDILGKVSYDFPAPRVSLVAFGFGPWPRRDSANMWLSSTLGLQSQTALYTWIC